MLAYPLTKQLIKTVFSAFIVWKSNLEAILENCHKQTSEEIGRCTVEE